MNYIAIWLLLFFDKENAFWMLTNLVENVLVPGFYGGQANELNGFFIESSVVGKLLHKIIPDLSANPHTVDFADMISVSPLMQLFVDVVDVQST